MIGLLGSRFKPRGEKSVRQKATGKYYSRSHFREVPSICILCGQRAKYNLEEPDFVMGEVFVEERTRKEQYSRGAKLGETHTLDIS